MNKILEVNGLSKDYGEFRLNEVTFTLPGGYIMGFIGRNGAGKTTTLKLILNVIKHDSGFVKLFGDEKTGDQNEMIGVVMDTQMYVEDWNARDVEKALSPFYSSWSREKYAGYLEQFSLDPRKKIKEFSRGMKIKLQLAAALSHDAGLLILDEPTSGLDPVARDEIGDILREFVCDEGKAVLFSTHITADLERTADYITFIQEGSIVFTGMKDDLLERYTRVAGGLNALSEADKKLIIGYREHKTGFEGMTETANIGRLPERVLKESISLDEIIIFMNKGAKTNE